MAEIVIKIPDDQYDRVVMCVTTQHQYQEQVRNPEYVDILKMMPNPVSREEALKEILINVIKDCVVAEESKVVMKEARETVVEDVKELSLT